MVDFVNNVRSFVNYAIFCELCDRMRSEVDCAKSHHRVISEGLNWPLGGVILWSKQNSVRVLLSSYDISLKTRF